MAKREGTIAFVLKLPAFLMLSALLLCAWWLCEVLYPEIDDVYYY